MTKYHSRKVKTAEGTFDSVREYERWIWLKAQLRSGHIEALKRQVPYVLIASQPKPSGGTERAVKYIADFVYFKNGRWVVEDVKGYKTEVYIIKRKLMLSVYGIEIQEI